jgi:hypothetical protein
MVPSARRMPGNRLDAYLTLSNRAFYQSQRDLQTFRGPA